MKDARAARLPRMEERDEPSGGWFVRAGMVLVGSRAMLDEGRPLAVIVSGGDDRWGVRADGTRARGDAEATLLPIYLDPMTKLFLVALMWCRPWLLDPGAVTPLPRTPEIAREALQATGAYHELERFDSDPAVSCLQARLAIDNFEDNWLTQAFALEYAALFHVINPGLAALGLPIPLGGTSNHFRIDALGR